MSHRTRFGVGASARLSLAVGAAALGPAAAFADGVDASVGWTREKVYRGLSLSDGKPALLVAATGHVDSGWSAGAAASLIAGGRVGDLVLSVGRGLRLDDDWSAQWNVEHDAYPGNDRRRSYDHAEWTGSVVYAERWQAAVSVSPDTAVYDAASGELRRTWAAAVDVALHQRLIDRWALDLGIGRASFGPFRGGYGYGSVGVSSGIGPVQGFVTYVVGPRSTGTSYGPSPGGGARWIATVLWSF